MARQRRRNWVRMANRITADDRFSNIMVLLRDNARAIAAMVAAMGLFVINDAFLKMATVSLPVTEAVALRGGFASLSLLGALIWRKELFTLRKTASSLVGLRGVIEFSGAFVFISALPFNSLANLTAIQQIVPLLMTAFAALFLNQAASVSRIIAVLLGFLGAVMIAQPDAGGLSYSSLAAFYCAFAVCGRDLIGRRIGSDVGALALAFATALIVFICTLAYAAITRGAWVAPSQTAMAQCVCAGVLVGLAQVAIAIAMRNGEVRAVAPFYYSQTLFGLIFSFLIFNDVPNALALLGMALIVAAGLYVVTRRESAAA